MKNDMRNRELLQISSAPKIIYSGASHGHSMNVVDAGVLNKNGSKSTLRSIMKLLLASILAASSFAAQAGPRKIYSAVIALGYGSASFADESWDGAKGECEEEVGPVHLDRDHKDLVYTYNGGPYVVYLGQRWGWSFVEDVCLKILRRDDHLTADYPTVAPGTSQSPRVLVTGTFNGKPLTFRGTRGDVLAQCVDETKELLPIRRFEVKVNGSGTYALTGDWKKPVHVCGQMALVINRVLP